MMRALCFIWIISQTQMAHNIVLLGLNIWEIVAILLAMIGSVSRVMWQTMAMPAKYYQTTRRLKNNYCLQVFNQSFHFTRTEIVFEKDKSLWWNTNSTFVKCLLVSQSLLCLVGNTIGQHNGSCKSIIKVNITRKELATGASSTCH